VAAGPAHPAALTSQIHRDHDAVRPAEPRIGVDWYETYHGEPDGVYPTVEAGNRALGFDGTFVGTYR
jgi:hypothetical protein